METIVLQIKETKLQADYAKHQESTNLLNQDRLASMHQELLQKERKISELEKKLRLRDEELTRLKDERDRLVQISNELRAELNNSQRRLFEQAEEVMGQNEHQQEQDRLVINE